MHLLYTKDCQYYIYKYIKRREKEPTLTEKNRVTIVQIDLYYSWEEGGKEMRGG